MLIELKTIIEIIKNNVVAQEVAFNTLKALGLIDENSKFCQNNVDEIENFESFFESFFNLWNNLPNELSIGKGNRENAKNKLKQYLQHTGHTHKQIIEATKSYIEDCIYYKRIAKFPQYFILPQYKKFNNLITDSDLYSSVTNPKENLGDIFTVHV